MIRIDEKFETVYEGLTNYYIFTGGRGGGKTFVAKDIAIRATYEKGHKILATRYSMNSAKKSIIPEYKGVIESFKAESDFRVLESEIINVHTNNQIIFSGIKTQSGNQTAKLKGIPDLTMWIYDEFEEEPNENNFDTIDETVRSKNAKNVVILILNPSFKSAWYYKRWFEPHNLPNEFTGVIGNVTYIHHNYLDNIENLSDKFLAKAESVRLTNPLRYNHRYLGHWLDDAEGLLWNRSILDRQRVRVAPELVRVIVSIDPAVTKTMDSDETGIVVLGKSANGHIYVLEDISGKYSPLEWATVANQAYIKWNCDAYVAEKNQGGDMVMAVIRQVDKTNRIILVTATKGKALRAEPIYSLYEQGKIWHVGMFPKLESQMVTFNPDSNKDSPDRVDAMVHGATELVIKRRTFAIA